MQARSGLVLEGAIRSAELMGVYVRNILYAAAKDIDKLIQQKTLQGQVAMLVFNLVSVKMGFGQCKRL